MYLCCTNRVIKLSDAWKACMRFRSLATLSTSDGRHNSRLLHDPVAKRQKHKQQLQTSHQLLRSNEVTSMSSAAACDSFAGLSSRQRRVCRRDIDNIRAVRQGALLAIDECQYQFRHRRWNCSVVDSVNVFGKVVATGK